MKLIYRISVQVNAVGDERMHILAHFKGRRYHTAFITAPCDMFSTKYYNTTPIIQSGYTVSYFLWVSCTSGSEE